MCNVIDSTGEDVQVQPRLLHASGGDRAGRGVERVGVEDGDGGAQRADRGRDDEVCGRLRVGHVAVRHKPRVGKRERLLCRARPRQSV